MSEKERKILQRICIKMKFKYLLFNAKRGFEENFCAEYRELYGMIFYMEGVGDISEENGAKVRKLVRTISKKYNIWRY